MTPSQQNFVSRLILMAQLLQNQTGEMASLAALWFGAANYDGEITDAELAAIPTFEGIDHTTLQEFTYALDQIRVILADKLAYISILTVGSSQP